MTDSDTSDAGASFSREAAASSHAPRVVGVGTDEHGVRAHARELAEAGFRAVGGHRLVRPDREGERRAGLLDARTVGVGDHGHVDVRGEAVVDQERQAGPGDDDPQRNVGGIAAKRRQRALQLERRGGARRVRGFHDDRHMCARGRQPRRRIERLLGAIGRYDERDTRSGRHRAGVGQKMVGRFEGQRRHERGEGNRHLTV